jgi:hypothetical protein
MCKTCPHCGEELKGDETRASNGRRTITLEIPEEEWPLMRLTFQQMNTRFGMMGNGTMANMLNPWLKKFYDDFEMMRYFDDAKMVMVYRILNNGWPCEVLIEDTDRINAHDKPVSVVTLRIELEEGHSDMVLSNCAPRDVARDFKAYLEDYIERSVLIAE